MFTQWPIFFMLIFSLTSTLVKAASLDHEINNGGDPLRLLFKQAQIDAPKDLENILTCSFPAWVTTEMQEWIMEHKMELARDIMFTNHIWEHGKTQKECAITQIAPMSDIHFSFSACRSQLLNSNTALELLIHESSHHLGISDEQEADKIAKAISNSFRAESCSYDNHARLKIGGSLYRSVLSSKGRFLAKFDNTESGTEIWDLVLGKKIYFFDMSNPFGSTFQGINPELMSFTPDEKKFIYIRKDRYVEILDLENLNIKRLETKYPTNYSDYAYSQLETSENGRYIAWSTNYVDHNDGGQYYGIVLLDTETSKFSLQNTYGRAWLRFQTGVPRLTILSKTYELFPHTNPIQSNDNSCTVQVWDYAQDKVMRQFQALDLKGQEDKLKLTWRCFDPIFSRDGLTLHLNEDFYTYSNYDTKARTVIDRFWNVVTGKVISEKILYTNNSKIYDISVHQQFSSNADKDLGGPTNTYVFGKTDRGYPVQTLTSNQPLFFLPDETIGYNLFSPNEKWLLTWSAKEVSTKLRFDLYDVTTGLIAKSWVPEEGEIRGNLHLDVMDNGDVLEFSSGYIIRHGFKL